MQNRRMKFIYAQVGGMLTIIFLLVVFSALSLPLFGVLSYFALLVNIQYFSLRANMGGFGHRVDVLIVVFGVIAIFVLVYEIGRIAGFLS